LGAIVPTIDNTMFARGIASLQKYLSSVGYMLFLTTSGYDLEAELQQARNLISRGVDGLVLRGDCHHHGLRKMLADYAIPFINVGVYRPDRPYPCVGTDNEGAAHRAASHVIELGHERIGIVSALPRNNDRASALVAGFHRALTENNIAIRAAWHVEVPYTLDDAREAARYLLSLRERPSAVVCGNDVIAYGVLLEAERSGFSVPRHSQVGTAASMHCPGILARDQKFEIETFMTFIKVLDVNLTTTFRTCMAFRPALARSKGPIVNIASTNATLALRIPAYWASKGVVMLTKALALAWAEEGIRVGAVAPGYVETAINAAGRPTAHYQRSRVPSPFCACRRRNMRPERWSRSTANFWQDER
jgi:NAD(P)-dependent dehydrogenase (short-subunit alcohol dehydrogenase family)